MKRRFAELILMQHQQIREEFERRLIDAPHARFHRRTKAALQRLVCFGQSLYLRIAKSRIEQMRGAHDDLRHRHEMGKITVLQTKALKRQVVDDHALPYRFPREWEQSNDHLSVVTPFERPGSGASHDG